MSADPNRWRTIKQLKEFKQDQNIEFRQIPLAYNKQGHSPVAWSIVVCGIIIGTYVIGDWLDNGEFDRSFLKPEQEKDTSKEKPLDPVVPEPQINVSELKTNVSGLQQNVSGLKERIGNLTQNITILKGNESKLEEKVNQTEKNVINVQENVTDLQTQFNYNSFNDAWSDLNTTKLNPAEVNRTVSHLKSDLRSYSSLFKQAKSTIENLNDTVKEAEQYNTYINENLSKVQQILSKGVNNLIQSDINYLERYAENLSKLADKATAYTVDLDERYAEELNDLNGILSDLGNKKEEIQAYSEDIPIFTENYDSKTSRMQQVINNMKDAWHRQYMNIKNSSVKTIERAASNYNRNITQLKNLLSNFTAKNVNYVEENVEDLEVKLDENATTANNKVKQIDGDIEKWYNTGKTMSLDNTTFWKRYDNITDYNQRDAFLNVTIDSVRLRDGIGTDDLKTMRLYVPNDSKKEYIATFELIDGSSIEARYNQQSFPGIKNIFNYLAFGK